jgi:hypothetical protein
LVGVPTEGAVAETLVIRAMHVVVVGVVRPDGDANAAERGGDEGDEDEGQQEPPHLPATVVRPDEPLVFVVPV